ncbi:MAG TPA: hypothetical protein VJ888_04945 [Mobilitalea sp.]|nr:hypothetical protein [Mobilitalea sp.]
MKRFHIMDGIRNRQIIGRGLKGLLFATLVFITTGNLTNTKAADDIPVVANQVNVKVDYQTETATVLAGTGLSTKFYISKDKKSWEVIDTVVQFDISTLLKTKTVPLYLKGNKDAVINEVTLQALDSTLKAVYEVAGGQGKITLSGTALPVEFRIGKDGNWKPAVNYMVTSTYEMNGATLYFRTVATPLKRSGKIVSAKIPKRPSAPSVKVDGSKLIITGLKNGAMQYRVGDTTDWIMFKSEDKSVKYLDLNKLLGKDLPANAPIPAGIIEVRTVATAKKPASAIKVIEVPAQSATPSAVTINASKLSVTDTDAKRAYEYARVPATATFNLKTAKWVSFTASKPATIKKLAAGEKLYVRIKTTKDKVTKQVIPASTYKELIIDAAMINKSI